MRQKLETFISEVIKDNYSLEIDINLSIPDVFEHGDFTLPCFIFAKGLRKAPHLISSDIKELLLNAGSEYFSEINNIGPYLNFKVNKKIFFETIYHKVIENECYGNSSIGKNKKIMVEFSSPNTNKPLHLGHIRNNLLGDSISRIYRACGYQVIKANLVNDRGIHICKSMLAWQKFGNNESPDTESMKGDFFVGKYYVLFDQKLKEEEAEYFKNKDLNSLSEKEHELAKKDFQANSVLLNEARDLLIKWENGDSETLDLWKKMNKWTLDGHEFTYSSLGIEFDKYYFESDTYKLGKDNVLKGLDSGVCYKKEDGSIWIKLPKKGFNNDKLILRKDGTSVYMTQDIGTAFLKFNDFDLDKSIYVVGNEQDYHFRVLFKAVELLSPDKKYDCYHLSYGMINLPEGKMKSREGTVVDADDFVTEIIEKSKEEIVSRNRPFDENELDSISSIVGLGALKFNILQFNPKSDFIFDPKASIDFNGKTGPYIQYTHARICSLLGNTKVDLKEIDFSSLDKKDDVYILRLVEQFPYIVQKACEYNNTSTITEFLYNLASAFNTFYSRSDNKIISMTESEQKPKLALALICQKVLKNGLSLLGINSPDKM